MNWSDELAISPRRRLHADVAQAIHARVKAGAWAPGTRLPSDRELADQLKVSRPTVREALLVLEFAGVVEIKHGAGAFVMGNVASAAADPRIGNESPRQLVEARVLLEPVIAGLAASRLSDSAVEELDAVVERSEAAIDSSEDGVEFVRLGLQFHHMLAQGCGNDYLGGFCTALVSLQDHPLWRLLHRQVLTTAGSRRRELGGHRHIVEAIRGHDPVAAGRAMEDHLRALWSIVLEEGYPGSQPGAVAAGSER